MRCVSSGGPRHADIGGGISAIDGRLVSVDAHALDAHLSALASGLAFDELLPAELVGELADFVRCRD